MVYTAHWKALSRPVCVTYDTAAEQVCSDLCYHWHPLQIALRNHRRLLSVILNMTAGPAPGQMRCQDPLRGNRRPTASPAAATGQAIQALQIPHNAVSACYLYIIGRGIFNAVSKRRVWTCNMSITVSPSGVDVAHGTYAAPNQLHVL
jgi:hypothetical protein